MNSGNDLANPAGVEQGYDLAEAALAGGVGLTADLPGPDVGFVRVYGPPALTANALAAPLVSVALTLQPGGQPLSTAISGASTASGSLTSVALPIAAGETIRATNGGATAGRITGQYYDVPAASLTVQRLTLSAAAQNIWATPATGRRRVWPVGAWVGITQSVRASVYCFNPDTIAHSLEFVSAGNLVGRSASVGAGSIAPLGNFGAWYSADLQARLAAAPATTSPVLFVVSQQGY